MTTKDLLMHMRVCRILEATALSGLGFPCAELCRVLLILILHQASRCSASEAPQYDCGSPWVLLPSPVTLYLSQPLRLLQRSSLSNRCHIPLSRSRMMER